MAYDKDQNEPSLPAGSNEKRESSNLLPRFYRTDSNKKFLQATLDQLVQPGTVKKVNGYIGRQYSKANTTSDIFLEAVDKERQDYQLEPSAVITDYLGNTTFFKDYIDHINHVKVFDGNVKHHSRLNKQEFYSWNPHINWDKFVNFQQYYWLPFGPATINVAGQQQEIISTYSVTLVDDVDNFAYIFNPEGPAEGLVRNPTLTLYRGQTYVFDVDTPGHPFNFKTERSDGSLDRYNQGVTGNGIDKGKLTFEVPLNSPDVIYYVSENAVDTGGVIHILDIEENTFIDIEAEVIGKKTYAIPNTPVGNVELSNGMKLRFIGKVVPEEYSKGHWYVEGVGSSIKLISEKDLEVRSTYVEESSLLFDDIPFDQLPFSEVGALPSRKDYVVINRSSPDNNPWSRYNRWFHADVIEISSKVNQTYPEFDQLSRATRPIVEFNSGLKLFNFGTIAKKSVDLIDNFTKDVFSTIEGSLGYNVDGVDLADGMRIIFNADTDILVKNKTYKVNFIEVVSPGRKLNFDPTTSIDLSRSIVTFDAEHGLSSGNQVTYLSNEYEVIPGLVNRTTYWVQVIDQLTISLYKDPNLTKQAEILALVSGIQSFEVYSGKRRQIQLTEEYDVVPTEGETASIRFGQVEQLGNTLIGNQGQTYWFNGTSWVLSQVKTSVNQSPLFDLFDNEGVSFSDTSKYDGSSFKGNKLFSYKASQSGATDSELGFPLTYQNINNIGDIVFDFNLLNDTFAYKIKDAIFYKNTDTGFLKISETLDRFSFVNGWTTSKVTDYQPIVRTYKGQAGSTFNIDVFNNKDDLEDLKVRVYVNGKKLTSSQFAIETGVTYKVVRLNTAIFEKDILVLKCSANQAKNTNGHYELPINLQNNPLNKNLEIFTLGQVVDHVSSIVDNLDEFDGIFPGGSNLKDLGNITPYGTKFVQHSGSLNLPLYFFGSKETNIVKALDKAKDDYSKFKRSFILTATDSDFDGSVEKHVNYVLEKMNKDKPKSSPYYLSDMVPYSGSNKITYTVLDGRIKTYPLSSVFNLKTLSNKAVGIYLNGTQLIEGSEYVFGNTEFFEILIDLAEEDIIEAVEYVTTDGCFCPATPTKLGLFPKYEPSIYIDDTYTTPTKVIQGHDGSITVAFNDYRDDLILEFEKRVFNNIKVQYDTSIFDIYDYIPGYGRTRDYSIKEYNEVLSIEFFKWLQLIGTDFTKNIGYDVNNPFTFNYTGTYTPDEKDVPFAWRGIYSWLFDTTRPHTHPWECLGFTVKPLWWDEQYGPSPYTKDNLVLWDDIKLGIIREPGKPVVRNKKFERPILENRFPVTESGKLVSPSEAGFVSGILINQEGNAFKFGDVAPVESAWRRSSYYPFAIIKSLMLLAPSDVLGKCLDRSRIVRDYSGQLVYKDTGVRLRLDEIKVSSVSLETTTNRVYTSGLINYVLDFLVGKNLYKVDKFKQDLLGMTNKLSSRLGAFTSKQKYKILLDSKNPSASSGVFVPDENYNINLNVSSAIKKVVYSGVIVTKVEDGFEIKGYNYNDQYFTVYPYRIDGKEITVGGISETYSTWDTEQYYVAGKIIRVDNIYYRVKVSHTSGSTFNESLYIKLPSLPVVGGKTVKLRKGWDYSNPIKIAYNTVLATIQDVADFLQGYGEFLKAEGFVFDDFNNNLSSVANWITSIKEFLTWTGQNWATGSTISLSPSANKLTFSSTNAVVDSVVDSFYDYGIFKLDGKKLDPEFINVYRSEGLFTISPSVESAVGIYCATLYLVQKEHVVMFDNTTMFNDTIYDKETGYRQDRLKILGYVTSQWNGSFETPGFVYDQLKINSWEPWTDYKLGDIVKYKEFYFSARTFIPGKETFDYEDWFLLENKLESKLLPNWDYKAEQFTDFYDLDTDNFDVEQQRVAQHLIGYQKRQYLENIINNDVSQYKFYQGMIVEKGTKNVFNKLFDVLSADNMESLAFDEEWAFRVGEYGAVDSFDEIELLLNEKEFKINPQPIELVDAIDPTIIDFVYRQTESDVYIKPKNYKSNLWPLFNATNFLRTPGHVRVEDLLLSVENLESLLSVNELKYLEGNYIHTSFEGPGWNVYRITKTNFKITRVDYVTGGTVLHCNAVPSVAVGDILRLESGSTLSSFLKVVEVNNLTIKVGEIKGTPTLTKPVISFYLKKVRFDNIDNVDDQITYNIKPNETIWVDDVGTGYWGIFKNNKIFVDKELRNTNPATNLTFGKMLSIAGDGNTCAVSSEVLSGESSKAVVTIFEKSNTNTTWNPTNTFYRGNGASFDTFGDVTKFSRDGNWFVISAPAAGVLYLYKRQPNRKYDRVGTITNGSTFGTNVDFVKVGSNYFLSVYRSSDAKVFVYKHLGTDQDDDWNLYTEITGDINDQFGYDLAMANESETAIVAITAPQINKVFIYADTGSTFEIDEEIVYNPSAQDFENFGKSITVSEDGKYIAVGASLLNRNNKIDVGAVVVFKKSNNYTLVQVINPKNPESNEQFGTAVEFMNNDQTLAIFSINKDAVNETTFDSRTTTFDKGSCTFRDVKVDAATIDIYDRFNVKFLYGETLTNVGTKYDKYGYSIAVGKNTVMVSAINKPDRNFAQSGKVLSYTKPNGKTSWIKSHEQSLDVDVSKIKKAFLYNKRTNKLVTYLDVVDTQQGKLPGVADQEIKFKTYYDPAVYSKGAGVNVDEGLNWTDDQVGMLWWDLTKARFNDNHTGDSLYKSSNWNKLHSLASIDVYEWVSTNLLPEAWSVLADTEEGLARGISGSPKYGNNVYSSKSYFDNISQSLKTTYYYWVKNKKNIPNVEGRNLSASNVGKLLEDPISYGYPCVVFNSENCLSLVNVERYLEDADVVLNIQYWLTDNRTNFHSQWKLLSLHKNTVIPTAIESKWFHSLIGKDDDGRLVPDFKLPLKNRYGIEYRPRQGMFVNRTEALKQYIERVNSVVKNILVADTYNLSKLLQSEQAPSEISGLWDQQIDIEEELKFVPTKNFSKPAFTPVINNGKIIDVNIVSSGNGYAALRPYQYDTQTLDPIAWYGPDLIISGTGKNAVIKTVVNSLGQVIETEILEGGEGYDSNTVLSTRSLSVLVTSDTFALESWTIYEWSMTDSVWERVRSQAYNVTKYWNYIDWYKEGYNQFTKIDRIFENTYQLVVTDVPLNSVVKINNVGSGGWMLLRKYNDLVTVDYTQNYEVIARQNGTIQFLDSIYDTATTYDNILLDANLYDNYPVIELKAILESVRDDILVDEYRVEYLKLFFASIKYILHEQVFVDWVFKTSFVKSQHNVGNLTQKITYKNDNLENFEEYIKEVKPYRTKIREFVSSYSSLDPSQTVVTDFDLLPVIDENYKVSPLTVYIEDNNISTINPEINNYPWKNWADTLGFKITSIKIVNGGAGYISNPLVEIVGDQLPGGTPAKAKAYVANKKVNRIDLIEPGSKWIKAPTVIIKGGLGAEGVDAKAVAIIGEPLARSNITKMKFDRISKTFQITNLEVTENFVASGSRTQFPLIWSPNIGIDTYVVYVNDAEVLKNDYKLTSVSSFNGTFTEYAGLLTFNEAPSKDSTIVIEYHKNVDHLSATERINFFYKPTAGQLGKDLSQLMTGVDYGGVAVTGLGFDASYGWDNLPWFSEVWDATSPGFDDFIIDVTDPVSYQFRLPYVPEKNQVLNIYIARFNTDTLKHDAPVRVDDLNYLTINQTNENALMTSFVGDGEIDIIVLPTTTDLQSYVIDNEDYGDRVIIRKIESDGSQDARDDDYDTKLSGGNLAYSSATGFAPDDIILDGDDFVSAMTSHAPEEVVPGQLMDTLAIKVYSRPSGGCPNIMFKSYTGDGSTREFIIGQYFLNNNSVIVKVGTEVLKLDVDYTIDYQNNKVVFATAPESTVEVSIVSISFNSENILDLDYFVADGNTSEYVTRAPWLPNANVTILVNGQTLPFDIFSTDSDYTDLQGQTWRSRLGFRFPVTPSEGSIINYIIDTANIVQTASVVKSQTITYQEGTDVYSLSNQIGIDLPLEANVIVKTNNNILSSPAYNYFTLKDLNLTYALEDNKYQGLEVNVENLLVYLDGDLLSLGADYSVNLNYSIPLYGIDINNFVLEGGTGYTVGDIITVQGGTPYTNTATFLVAAVLAGGVIQRAELIDPGLYIENPTAPFVLTGGTGNGAGLAATFALQQDLNGIEILLVPSKYVEGGKLVVAVTSLADYSIDLQTITFNNTYADGTEFEVLSFFNHNNLGIERTVDVFNFTPILDPASLEYYEYNAKLGGVFRLNSTVPSGDFVWVIKNGNLLVNKLDYELSNDKQKVILKTYLSSTDKVQVIAFTNTVVEDEFGFMQFKDIMNRTHYKRLNKDKTTTLAHGLEQFDREIYVLNPSALDDPIPSENKPGIIEINGERIEYFVKDGNFLRQLRRGTLGTGIPERHASESLVQSLGPSETIPYKDEFLIARSDEKREDGSLVQNQLYSTGKMIVDFVNVNPQDSIEVFVGGFRLKKNQFTLYTNTDYPYSPEGDTTYPPEFSYSSGLVQLRDIPAPGVLVTVVKKQGKIWADMGKRLASSENTVATFIKAAKTVWPEPTFRS
jgi:hypothetical protein